MKNIFERFLTEKRYVQNISPKTEESYRWAFLKFSKYIPNISVLNRASLTEFVIGMRTEGLKPGACNVYIRSMNSFLSWCFENEISAEHLKIKQIKSGSSIIKVFSDAHIRALLNFKPVGRYQWRTWAISCLLIDSGMRIDEALSLKFNDVNLEELLLIIKGKGDKERFIPISPEMRKVIFRFLKKRFESDYLFSASNGNRIDYKNYVRDLKAVCSRLGIDGVRVSPHSFRHYFSINYLRMGGDLYRLSRILGHTSVRTTEVYLRSMGAEIVREAHKQFSPLSRMAMH